MTRWGGLKVRCCRRTAASVGGAPGSAPRSPRCSNASTPIPRTAALCVVDSLAAGPEALERRARVVDALVGAVDRGRREAGTQAGLNRVIAEGVVGAVLGVLYTRLREPAPKPLLSLRGQLMSMIVLPYLGPEAAAAELARRAPRARRQARSPEDPLEAPGHAPHLPHDARAERSGGAAGAQQPPDRARRGRRRPGPDVEAADAVWRASG